MTELYWDPFDTAIDLDPHPLWRRMREELPVYRNERFGFFALSRYADVEAAHLDHETFSSAHGTVLELMTPDPYPAAPMIFMDPPAHTMLRVLVSRAFTPRRMAALEDYVRKLCADLLDRRSAGPGSTTYRISAPSSPRGSSPSSSGSTRPTARRSARRSI